MCFLRSNQVYPGIRRWQFRNSYILPTCMRGFHFLRRTQQEKKEKYSDGVMSCRDTLPHSCRIFYQVEVQRILAGEDLQRTRCYVSRVGVPGARLSFALWHPREFLGHRYSVGPGQVPCCHVGSISRKYKNMKTDS